MAEAAPPRHALLRVRLDAWDTLCAENAALGEDPLLAGWAARGWPLVARRRLPGDPPNRVPAGIPLPPAHGKRRIAVALAPNSIVAVEPPPRLADLGSVAPAAWRETIVALLTLGHETGSEPRLFGSFAWTLLTNLNYIVETSDLDLLWRLTPETDHERLVDRLAAIEAGAPGRIDGELLDARGVRAVQWREWRESTGEVLIKTIDAVMLAPKASFLAGTAR